MFSFVDTLGEYQEVNEDDVIQIHTPVKHPTAALILIDHPEGAFFSGSYEAAREMVKRFNNETDSEDKLLPLQNTELFCAVRFSQMPLHAEVLL